MNGVLGFRLGLCFLSVPILMGPGGGPDRSAKKRGSPVLEKVAFVIDTREMSKLLV